MLSLLLLSQYLSFKNKNLLLCCVVSFTKYYITNVPKKIGNNIYFNISFPSNTYEK